MRSGGERTLVRRASADRDTDTGYDRRIQGGYGTHFTGPNFQAIVINILIMGFEMTLTPFHMGPSLSLGVFPKTTDCLECPDTLAGLRTAEDDHWRSPSQE